MKDNTTRSQYQGFLNTPQFDLSTFDLEEWRIDPIATKSTPDLPNNLVLGRRAEHFMRHQIEINPDLRLLTHNLQIKQDGITLGEVDYIVQQESTETIIHLELAYKIYLYAPDHSPRDPWIGPNFKDSLVQKCVKLKEKQLPLIQTDAAQNELRSIGVDTKDLEQKVLIKTLLFSSEPSNPSTSTQLAGSWLPHKDFVASLETGAQYYIPTKVDWMIIPHSEAPWIDHKVCLDLVDQAMELKKSPMVWKKEASGALSRFFVVWW